jgi:trehalose 2-sulfotransferase
VIPDKGYVICGEARAGSTFLAHLLKSTGKLGNPWEMFAERNSVEQILREPKLLADKLQRASSDNGVYGLKIFSPHFDLAERADWAERLPGLQFVHLRRDDLLAQAISLVRAQQTGQYKSTVTAGGEPRYDGRTIADRLTRLAHGHARWECYFARNGIRPLRLVYEDVAANPQAAVDAIAGLLGLSDAKADLSEVELNRQTAAVTADWTRRFVAEMGDLSYLDGGLLFSGRRGGGSAARLVLGPKRRGRASVAGGAPKP